MGGLMRGVGQKVINLLHQKLLQRVTPENMTAHSSYPEPPGPSCTNSTPPLHIKVPLHLYHTTQYFIPVV